MTRAAALLLILAAGRLAPAQVVLFTAAPERRVESHFEMGDVPVGDAVEARFLLRNTGLAPAPVTMLRVAGSGFSVAGAPALPLTLAAGAWLDFSVRFEPAAAGGYSASLLSDGVSAILLATAAAAAAVAVEENGAWRTLAAGTVVDFGAVERGSSALRRFAVSNRTGPALPAVRVSVSPGAFALAPGTPEQVVLAPGETVVVAVWCVPAAAGPLESVLAVGGRLFVLRAGAVEPPLPELEIALDLAEARSARQGRVSVRLASPSRTRAAGEVRLEFEPAAGLGDDPAIVFSSGGRRAVFSVEEDDSAARFGGSPWVEFQTGSTAGTLAFVLEAGGRGERRTVAIAPAPAGIASTRAVRDASSVEVEIGGFDNTRAVSQLIFTFFERGGAVVAPGPIRVDAADAFRRYFETSALGGTFVLRAVFPVTGGADRIESVEAELVNPAGGARTGTLRPGYQAAINQSAY